MSRKMTIYWNFVVYFAVQKYVVKYNIIIIFEKPLSNNIYGDTQWDIKYYIRADKITKK